MQIRALSKELDVLETDLFLHRNSWQLHDEVREMVLRWATDRNPVTREKDLSLMLVQCGAGEKELQRSWNIWKDTQTKLSEKTALLGCLLDRLKLDANLHLSEKSELVMDDDEEDVQSILQILVLSHYQV